MTVTSKAQAKKFQSTLPRGERLFSLWLLWLNCNFNPRSHEGSDNNANIWYDIVLDFNPRSHEGSDHSFCPLYFPDDISIHAPTRGATSVRIKLYPEWTYFNPRSHEGSDPPSEKFLSNKAYFNPRSHEGSDRSA